jgi:cyclophilin family peptidyl-prolyl cis-trans isomerase
MIRRILTVLLLVLCATCAARGDQQNRPKVVIQTNFGDIGLELYEDQAPITVGNFLTYVDGGFYNGLLFHRIIENFMIQGGGYFLSEGTLYKPQPAGPIVNESGNGLSNLRGTIAMARSSDPDSATSQFYINHVDNTALDRAEAADGFGYCVFGRVLSGMDVVDLITGTPTANIGYGFANFPYPTLVYIEKAGVAPPGHWLAGDFNNDGIVDFGDFAMLASSLTAASGAPAGDLDGDSQIGTPDIALLADNWLSTADWYQ